MPVTETSMFRSRIDVLAEMLAELVGAVPDAYTGEDGVIRIIFEIDAGQLENAFLAHQILLEDMFITTASQTALQRHGQQYGIEMKLGTPAEGTLTFFGDGGTYIPIGAEAGYDPGSGLDVIYFETTTDGTTPNPGNPTAPTLADAGAGSLPAGTYEYGVTFQTAEGETELGAVSAPLTIAASHNINVTAIPLGGPGTTARNLYRRINGGVWTKNTNASIVSALNNNTATSVADGSTTLGSEPPEESTAESITLNARAQELGVDENVGIGTVTVLTNAPATLLTVTNKVAFSGGSDPEDTERFRQRLLLFVQAPGTGSPSDLKAWAENVNGVETATVFPNSPGPGQVTVRISGPNGSVPSADTIANVQAELEALDLANIQITVTSFTAQPTNVTVDVTTSGTYTLADVTPTVQFAISEYINSLEVGGTLYVSGIVDAVFGLPGISDVVMTTPTTNQTTAATDKRTPGTITVT